MTLRDSSPQQGGSCNDINYDPLILPQGISGSDDPLLNARSADASAFDGLFRNRWLWGAILLSLLLQVAVV